MNIFYLDHDPQVAATYHNDSHCNKMITESAQLLSTTCWLCGIEAHYQSTHKNHKCRKWVGESIQNYRWLCYLGLHLAMEFYYRRGKTHKVEAILLQLLRNQPKLPNIGLTKPALAMPEQYHSDDPVAAYRAYYIGAKRHLAKWERRGQPDWWH